MGNAGAHHPDGCKFLCLANLALQFFNLADVPEGDDLMRCGMGLWIRCRFFHVHVGVAYPDFGTVIFAEIGGKTLVFAGEIKTRQG